MYMYVPFPTRKAYLTTINHAKFFAQFIRVAEYRRYSKKCGFLLTRLARENLLKREVSRTRRGAKMTDSRERGEKKEERKKKEEGSYVLSGGPRDVLGCINVPPLITLRS